MKPLITRWKVRPSLKGSDFFSPVSSSVHSWVPVASPVKFRTVLGAWLGKSSIRMSPLEVCKVANMFQFSHEFCVEPGQTRPRHGTMESVVNNYRPDELRGSGNEAPLEPHS